MRLATLLPMRGSRAAGYLRSAEQALRHARTAEPLEFDQMMIRYAVGLVITVYAGFSYTFAALQGRPAMILGVLLIVAWGLGLGLLIHLAIWPHRRVERRVASIICDALALSLFLAFGEKSAAIFFPIYIWVTLGNGFRFGLPYMYAAIVANLTGFGAMVAVTPYWQEAWQFAVGLALAIVAIPFYVAKLIRNLRSAMSEAEAASRAKTEFLSMMSHELRTPLNAILGLAQISKLTASNVQERFTAVSTELAAGRLLRMVDTILKFQRIESGAAERLDRSFDVLQILNEVQAIIEPLARQKGLDFRIRFSSGLPAAIRSDPDHIQTIILNLAANAVKYTIAGSVSLEVGVSDGEGGKRLRIAVRDTGTGISPDEQSRIFERFVRAQEHNASGESGVGLGLSVCKSLTELLGGTLACESAPGVGSLFWAELPIVTAAETRVSESTAFGAAGQFAPVLWLGRGSPAVLEGFAAGRIVETPEALDEIARSQGAVSSYVLVCDPLAITAEMQAALSAAMTTSDRRPSLVLITQEGVDASALEPLATAVARSLPKAEVMRLITTVARWHWRISRQMEEEAPSVTVLTRSLTILVADDNGLNREVTRRMLELDGHRVILAETGDDALHHLLEGTPDVALLDINMPGLTGVDVCQAYRTGLGAAARIPIIGLTADISDQMRENCLRAGMRDILGKPVTIDQLRRAIASHVPVLPASQELAARRPGGAGPAHRVADTQRTAFLLNLFGEDSFDSSFLASFQRDLDGSLGRLRQGVRQHRPKLVRDALHAIKSSAGTAGAQEILELAGNFSSDDTAASHKVFEAEIRAAFRRYSDLIQGERRTKHDPAQRVIAASSR
ncbi:MAG: ATP-binding protein [Rhodomicrobiaceae bacterium]